ncbi:MAG: class I mannose-6-phosphate isomerase [Planctomycetota bacterium]|nr:class I mannose-6-phosphate isomerase [Planctomycetota bacterium]
MNPYPLLFEPILLEKVWGGRELMKLHKPLPDALAIGESWELADRPDSIAQGRSVIANGALKGQTLREAMSHAEDVILGDGKRSHEGGFPLLIKYLDARGNLSVQVHPDEAYVEAHPDTHLKSEAWYIIDAEPGALIYKGVDPDCSPEEFASHIGTDKVVDDLIAIPARPGDLHYLPSGTCHALGAGIVVAEIQTPSDTTFRVHDWGRTSRALHIEPALACIQFGPGPHNQTIDAILRQTQTRIEPIVVEGTCSEILLSTDFFDIERVRLMHPGRLEIVTNGMPIIWMILEGAGRIDAPGAHTTPVRRGDTLLLPAGLNDGQAIFDEPTTLLHITLPSPLKGLIA